MPTLLAASLLCADADAVMASDAATSTVISLLEHGAFRNPCAAALSIAINDISDGAKAALGDANIGAALINVIKTKPPESFFISALTILQDLGESCGMREIGLEEDAQQVIVDREEAVPRKSKNRKQIQELVGNVVEDIALAFGNHPSFKLKAKFEELSAVIAGVSESCTLHKDDETGAIEFEDAEADAERSSEVPEAYADLTTHLDEMCLFAHANK